MLEAQKARVSAQKDGRHATGEKRVKTLLQESCKAIAFWPFARYIFRILGCRGPE
jgi:hypothetical protein